jgi:Sulfotransferase family
VSRTVRAVARALGRRPIGPHPQEVFAALERLGPFETPVPGEDESSPVFVLGTGWRTGSTLLQRVLMTDRRLLLWGEPLGRLGLLTRLSEAVCGMQTGWPPDEHWIERRPPGDLTTSWIANLFPPADDFRASLRALFERWLGEPARARGYARWGFKEVRLGAAEGTLLRWLYPSAQLVVISRDPIGAYRSVKGSAKDWRLYARWPDRRVDCVVSFARHWDSLASSWGHAPPGLAPFVVRYEELTAGGELAPLASRLGLSLDPAPALAMRVGETGRPAALSVLEGILLRRETRSGRRAMGYS